MLAKLKDDCLKVFDAVRRFVVTPGQSLWLAAVLVLTYVAWWVPYSAIGAGWLFLPPVPIVPLIACAMLVPRRVLLMPPFRPLKVLEPLAALVLIACVLQYFHVLPQRWHLENLLFHRVSGLHYSATKINAIGIFLIAAIFGRSPFVHLEERWCIGPYRPSAKERKIGLKFFNNFPLFSWGPHKAEFTFWLRMWFYSMRFVAVVSFLGAMAVPYVKERVLKGIAHDFTPITNFNPPAASIVISADGKLMCRYAVEDRQLVPLSQVPSWVIESFVAAEDKNFFEHDGIDPIAILRAVRHLMSTGSKKQGASTITQQLVKNLVLHDNTQSPLRKMREWFLAVELEKQPGMSKAKIIEAYLNFVQLGRGYGVEAASRAYYGKDVSQLTVGEAAFLGGMPKAPSEFSPSMHYARAKQRQAYVLRRMAEQGFITEQERVESLGKDTAVIMDDQPLNATAAPYACAFYHKQLKAAYGEHMVLKGGLVVYATIDLKMQQAAEAAVRNGLLDLERKIGFNGPTGHDDAFKGCVARAARVRSDDSLEIATVTSVLPGFTVCAGGETVRMHPDDQARIEAWQRGEKNQLKVGDTFAVKVQTFVRPKDAPKGTPEGRFAISAIRTAGKGHPEALEAALMSIAPTNAFIRTMVGGYDFYENQFNMAVQARRQIGSSGKPEFAYLPALMGTDKKPGKVVTDVVNDHPVCYYKTASGHCGPENYLGPHTAQRYMGPVTLKVAMAKSLNTVSAQLIDMYGIDHSIEVMRALGITSPIQREMTIAVGAIELTPWEHTAAFAGIASGGKRLPRQFGNGTPGIFILKVTDAKGQTLYAYEEEPMAQAVPASAAYADLYLMKGVVEEGTGKRARELGRPVAGKTGTTNDFKDAWFMGCTADLCTGVWVGRQTPATIAKEATGGTVALPIWLSYMEAAHPKTPPREFPVPDDVTVMMDEGGKPVPFQRGRMPAKFLTSTKSE